MDSRNFYLKLFESWRGTKAFKLKNLIITQQFNNFVQQFDSRLQTNWIEISKKQSKWTATFELWKNEWESSNFKHNKSET